jgi:hypothetical protein
MLFNTHETRITPSASLLYFPRAIYLPHCASLAQFFATLCFPRIISATLCFPRAIFCHVMLPSHNFCYIVLPSHNFLPRYASLASSSSVSRRYSHAPSLPHCLLHARHDAWNLCDLSPIAPCTGRYGSFCHVHCPAALLAPTSILWVFKPSFVASPPTHGFSPLNHRIPKILGDHNSP